MSITGINNTYGNNYGITSKTETLADKKSYEFFTEKQQTKTLKTQTKEARVYIDWAFDNIKKKEDLDAIKKEVETYGTPKQRKKFSQIEHEFKKGTFNKKEAAIREEINKKKTNGLGNAKPSLTSTKTTWDQYCKEHGVKYEAPTSGLDEVSRRAKLDEMRHNGEALGLGKNNHGVSGVVEADRRAGLDIAKQNKITKLKKIGKFGLLLGLGGIVAMGIASLISSNRNSDVKPDFAPGLRVTDPDDKNKAPVAKPDKPETPVAPNTPNKPSVPTTPKTPVDTPNNDGTYIVQEGDNIWNIAKEELTEENNGKKPTNREIAERTKTIIEENNKKYEDDQYTVIILPGEKLQVSKKAA